MDYFIKYSIPQYPLVSQRIRKYNIRKSSFYAKRRISRVVKMPRKNKLTIDEAVAILVEFSDYLCNDKLLESNLAANK